MKLAATIGGAAVGLLACNSVVAPFAITMEPMVGEPIGQAHTFRITKVEGAVGKVSFRWNFGDGTPPITTSGIEAAHTYKEVGHYTVIVRATDTATGAAAQSQFVQTAHNPLTPRPPHNSTSIFIDEEHHEVWNVNPDKGSVSVIDANKLRRIREAPVGDEPHSLAPAPDGAIWVTNQMSDEVVVLDRSSGKIERRIGLPYASQPRAIAFGPNGKAYVSLFATGKLVEIDPISPDVRREVALGPTPAGVSVADDGRIFVTRFISPGDPGGKTPGELGHGEVWVVSPETLTLKNTIELPFDPGPDTESAGRGVPNYVSSIAISPDGTRAWASAKKDNVARGPERDGLPADSDNIVRAIVCVIDLKTEKEILAERIDIDNRSMVVAVAFSRVGDYGYLLLEANNWIGIYEVYNGGVAPPQLGGIKDVGSDEGAAHGGDGAPDGLAISRNGRLFVNAFLSRQVIAYDLSASIASVAHAPPPLLAKIRTIDQEPLPERVLRGKKVFFNAMDPRMSNVGYMACVSCHFEGMGDGRVWDFSDRGEGLRNTKSLLGNRGMGEGRVHWSANMDEIQDFERDIHDSLEGRGFMPAAEYRARLDSSGHYDTFGKPAAGVSEDLDALAAYITSLDKVPRSPFRNSDGSFTAKALAGRKIFRSAECGTCHVEPDFTDSAAGALHDVGTILPTSGTRLFGPLEGIDTPSLKGVWATAPYLHDGRAATLTEIFTKHLNKNEMGKTSGLDETQLAELVEYLQELDDVPETLPAEPPPQHHGLLRCSCRLSSSTRAPGSAAWFLAGPAMCAIIRRRKTRRHVPRA